MIFDLPSLVKRLYDLQRASFQPLLKLHELGDRALRPVVQGVLHLATSFDRPEVQNQLVSSVDVQDPPKVDKVKGLGHDHVNHCSTIRDMMVASSHVLSLIPGGTYPIVPMGIYQWAGCCFCKNK
jgi:hypothetical protein